MSGAISAGEVGHIERKIAIAAITSDDFATWLAKIYQPHFLESKAAKIIVNWCIQYAQKYGKAPKQDIETIYAQKKDRSPVLKNDPDQQAYIAEILASLSEEYDSQSINIEFLKDEALSYFKQRHLEELVAELDAKLMAGEIDEVEAVIANYNLNLSLIESEVDLYRNADEVLEQAFQETAKPLLKYPGALGRFINDQLVREGFVAFLAPEKRGKSFFMLDMMLRACRQGRRVAFFDAGDSSERKLMRRIAIYLARKSDKLKYCGELLIPVTDCRFNQLGTCEHKDKIHNLNWGPLKEAEKDEMNEIPFAEIGPLVEQAEARGYLPCRECLRDEKRAHIFQPSYWYRRRDPVTPLTVSEAQKALDAYRSKLKKNAGFKIACYANNTLTISEIKRRLDIWSKEGWDPEIIIIDYADLLAPEKGYPKELRHTINEIWKNLRSLSQERRCLLVTATQADSASYEKPILTLQNFSEDKRKYAHVTAMYGLNQTAEEKLRGILRLNELVIREDDFSVTNQVHILQRLQIGRPVLGSF